jgi:parallel beta-helix repeat protein
MKKRTITSGKRFVVGSALLLLFTLSASNAFGDFYVIAGSRGVGTKIASLPYTISSPGFYYIDKDLSCSGAHGITIAADNVTLDLMGFSLIGGGTYYGIYMYGRTNVEIRNGTVRSFTTGIYEGSFVNGVGHRVINIRARNNESSGIYLPSKNNLVEGCTATGNGGYGIYAYYGSTITGNTCYDNGDDGIYASYGSTVTGNTCFSNTDHGIYLAGNNLVDQNTATDNGMNMSSCPSCTFGTNHAPL